jgi:hypothetical protein
MMGRAGRPQYDTSGEGIIITTHKVHNYSCYYDYIITIIIIVMISIIIIIIIVIIETHYVVRISTGAPLLSVPSERAASC